MRNQQIIRQLWLDQRGSVEATNYVLFMTLLLIGVLVGLVSIRDQVVQEFGDIAAAMESLDQSYSFTIGAVSVVSTDTPSGVTDPGDGQSPAGIDLTVSATGEANMGGGGGGGGG